MPCSKQMVSSENVIYVVLEYGEVDLARLLQRKEAERNNRPGGRPDENFIRHHWQQMLQVQCGLALTSIGP